MDDTVTTNQFNEIKKKCEAFRTHLQEQAETAQVKALRQKDAEHTKTIMSLLAAHTAELSAKQEELAAVKERLVCRD